MLMVNQRSLRLLNVLSVDGKINLVVRYGSKSLEFAKGKNAIELESEVAELGQFDVLIKLQAHYGRRLTQKNK
mgnify:CR=1 FL=1